MLTDQPLTQRRVDRDECEIDAFVSLTSDGETHHCIIKNISRSGAKISIEADVHLPHYFFIRIPIAEDIFETRHCSLRWRVEATAGVGFIS